MCAVVRKAFEALRESSWMARTEGENITAKLMANGAFQAPAIPTSCESGERSK